MATIHPQPASLDAALAMLPSMPRPVLSRLVTRMIERLDQIDGDPEVEEDNEDCGHDDGEPDYRRPHWRVRKWAGPGCIISDSDYGAEDDSELVLKITRLVSANERQETTQLRSFDARLPMPESCRLLGRHCQRLKAV